METDISETEIIVSVKEIDTFKYKHDAWFGYEIVTNKQTIRVLISDFQNCCERYGVDMNTPDKKDIVGDTVISVGWAKNTCKDDDYLQTATVNLETSSGLTELIAYNEHNGYYPHSVYVEWNGYKDVQQI